MKTIRVLIVVMSFLSLTAASFAQQKYAVLIAGDCAAGKKKDVPDDDLWNGGIGGNFDFDEFWNDTYLMWEMLQSKGYAKENIFVLFAGGQDFYISNPNVASRYRPVDPTVIVTDYPATISNVDSVFNGLRYGSGGFPQVTADDFLFVWVFDHGGAFAGHQGFYLIDGLMLDEEFATLVNPIPANKKVYWMQQCLSGGFKEELDSINVVFNPR